jgi:hypothetical protein
MYWGGPAGGAGFETRSDAAHIETKTRIPNKIAVFNPTSFRGGRIQESGVRIDAEGTTLAMGRRLSSGF